MSTTPAVPTTPIPAAPVVVVIQSVKLQGFRLMITGTVAGKPVTTTVFRAAIDQHLTQEAKLMALATTLKNASLAAAATYPTGTVSV
jgi:hypothetical protein